MYCYRHTVLALVLLNAVGLAVIGTFEHDHEHGGASHAHHGPSTGSGGEHHARDHAQHAGESVRQRQSHRHVSIFGFQFSMASQDTMAELPKRFGIRQVPGDAAASAPSDAAQLTRCGGRFLLRLKVEIRIGQPADSAPPNLRLPAAWPQSRLATQHLGEPPVPPPRRA